MSAHDALTTADCKAYGCSQPAATMEGRLAGLCDEHAAVANRAGNGGEAASDATEVACRVAGCPHVAIAKVGPYARLCHEHMTEQREKRSEASREHELERRARLGQGAAQVAGVVRAAGGNVAALKTLMQLAKAADRARKRADKALQAARAARAEADRVEDDYQRALREASGLPLAETKP